MAAIYHFKTCLSGKGGKRCHKKYLDLDWGQQELLAH